MQYVYKSNAIVYDVSPRGVYAFQSPWPSARRSTRQSFVRYGDGRDIALISLHLALHYQRLLNCRKERMKNEFYKILGLFQLCAALATSTSETVVALPRGGWFNGAASERYRESLEEQVSQMDRQLRQARDEVSQLRARRKISKPVVAVGTTSGVDEVSSLDGKVEALTQQIVEHKKANLDLEAALTTSKMKTEELEQLVERQQEESMLLKEKFGKDSQDLRSRIKEKSEQETSEQEALLQERVTQAVSEARLEVEEGSSLKIERITHELQSSHQKELDAERKRSMEAVEEEKKKMRKLVKALAIREKKLAEQ